MKFYTTEECQKWIGYDSFYPSSIKMPIFKVVLDKVYGLKWHIADLNKKSFQHDVSRVNLDLEKITNNYPKLQSVNDSLNIFMCPMPSADTANACAYTNYICYFARSTQIPWCVTDYITAHELGHVVQYNFCDTTKDIFKKYLKLRNAERGICHEWIGYDDEKEETIYADIEDFLYLEGTQTQKQKYNDWDNNPQEWFAEDFRWFFGIDQGDKYWGLPITEPDDKIKEFLLSL